jgi:hypothetical protein
MSYKWRMTVSSSKGVMLSYHEENDAAYVIEVYGEKPVQYVMASTQILKLGESVYDAVETIREFLALHDANRLPVILQKHYIQYEVLNDEFTENGDNLLRPTEEYLDPKKLH